MKTFNPTEFIASTAKPLPVILLLDVSGSMSGAKIQNLNAAVEDMLDTFSDTETSETEIHVAIITFGAEVKLHQTLASASDVTWRDLSVSGQTPLGTALKMAKAMIEDKNVIPKGRVYRPTVVLVSDGQPTDDWMQPLADFIKDGRSSKCFRMALAIGADADENVLGKFIEGTDHPLFYAENGKQLRDFFRYVSESISERSRSRNPDIMPIPQNAEEKTNTISERAGAMEKPAAPHQSNDAVSSGDSEGGYW